MLQIQKCFKSCYIHHVAETESIFTKDVCVCVIDSYLPPPIIQLVEIESW